MHPDFQVRIIHTILIRQSVQRDERLHTNMGLTICAARRVAPAQDSVHAEKLLRAVDLAPGGDDEGPADGTAIEPADNEGRFGRRHRGCWRGHGSREISGLGLGRPVVGVPIGVGEGARTVAKVGRVSFTSSCRRMGLGVGESLTYIQAGSQCLRRQGCSLGSRLI